MHRRGCKPRGLSCPDAATLQPDIFSCFFTFLKVGAFAFGGGYAMLSLIGDSVLSFGWMNEAELLNFVGVETVIPGPIAVNMAPM